VQKNAAFADKLRSSTMPQLQGGKAPLITSYNGEVVHVKTMMKVNKHRVANNKLDSRVITMLDDSSNDGERKTPGNSDEIGTNAANTFDLIDDDDYSDHHWNENSYQYPYDVDARRGSHMPLRSIDQNVMEKCQESVSAFGKASSVTDNPFPTYSDVDELYKAVRNHCFQLSKSVDLKIAEAGSYLFRHLTTKCEICTSVCEGELSCSGNAGVTVPAVLDEINRFLPSH